MPELADIFNTYGSAYLEKFGDKILPQHKRAMLDITGCRTEYAGGHVDYCFDCQQRHYFYHSCCNRSCPKCQGNNIHEWLAKREAEILPVPYYHITVTFPQEMRYIIRSNSRKLLSILMREVANVLMELAADPKFVGGKISILEVLHTWSRSLIYHPHIHCLVPGGGLSFDGKHWIFARKSFFIPVRKLSYHLRERLKKVFQTEIPEIKFPSSIWKKQWVAHCKPAAQGADKVIQYLGRYVYKVALTNNRILSDKNGQITFKYKNYNDDRWRTMTLEAFEFIRRFLQHAPPKGFHKVRFYGLLSPKNRKLLSPLKTQLELAQKQTEPLAGNEEQTEALIEIEKKPRVCPHCKSARIITLFRFFKSIKPSFRGHAPP